MAQIRNQSSDFDAIGTAAMKGDIQTLQIYIPDIYNVNVVIDSDFGTTPLIKTCLGGKIAAVKYLVDVKADVNKLGKKLGPLHAVNKFYYLTHLTIICRSSYVIPTYAILSYLMPFYFIYQPYHYASFCFLCWC